MVHIGKIALDNGIPKICVPIVGRTLSELLQECDFLQHTTYDIIELRIDFFEQVGKLEAVGEVLTEIRKRLPGRPLLFTFRTKEEGGEKEIPETYYFELARFAINSGKIDAIDLEYFRNPALLKETMEGAKQARVTIVMSNHDFQKTPSFEEITSRLIGMKKSGADVAKLACMPHSAKDVLTLLGATEAVKSQYPEEPLITMSMGKLGAISRICGETFGSAITFGAAKQTSAPGQLDTETLSRILKTLH